MTSKGLRASCLSKYTEANASCNADYPLQPLLVIGCVMQSAFLLNFKIQLYGIKYF